VIIAAQIDGNHGAQRLLEVLSAVVPIGTLSVDRRDAVRRRAPPHLTATGPTAAPTPRRR
jgi:hypothetical protein